MLITNVLSKVRNLQQHKHPQINIGDVVKIKIVIKEGNKERLQQYEGTVIAKKYNYFVTVRKIFQNVGIEYVFPLFSPNINCIVIKKSSIVRRSKLYYLRNRIGKRAQLKTRITSNTIL